MKFLIFWFSISFIHATHIPSILPISVLENPNEISILSMKIVKLNESWAFLRNIWDDNPEVINLYGIGLKKDDSLFRGLGRAALLSWNQGAETHSSVSECFYIPSSKDVRPSGICFF
jgi:hypothetical protein